MCYFQSASLIRYILIRAKIEMNTQFLFPLRLAFMWFHWLGGVTVCLVVSYLGVERVMRGVCTWSKVEWTCQHLQDTKSEIQTCAKSAHFKMCSALLFDTGNHFLIFYHHILLKTGETAPLNWRSTTCHSVINPSTQRVVVLVIRCRVLAWKLNWHIMSLSRSRTCVWGLLLVDS